MSVDVTHSPADAPGAIIVVAGSDFAHCSTCGEPVGRDRDRQWCHLDDPYRRFLFDTRPPDPARPDWASWLRSHPTHRNETV